MPLWALTFLGTQFGSCEYIRCWSHTLAGQPKVRLALRGIQGTQSVRHYGFVLALPALRLTRTY
jgi:hypothetical protein